MKDKLQEFTLNPFTSARHKRWLFHRPRAHFITAKQAAKSSCRAVSTGNRPEHICLTPRGSKIAEICRYACPVFGQVPLQRLSIQNRQVPERTGPCFWSSDTAQTAGRFDVRVCTKRCLTTRRRGRTEHSGGVRRDGGSVPRQASHTANQCQRPTTAIDTGHYRTDAEG